MSAEAATAGRLGDAAAGRRREPVSIVTVFNDAGMRRACLDASLEAHRGEAPDVEYLPIDNSAGAFAGAGAALNHGAARARHDYVVFVHQDVRLHSLAALEEAAGLLAAQTDIGLLGAIGVTAEGRFHGTVRDRVVLVGEPAAEPAPVDCVDELLFMVSRRVLELEPLPEDPELAWHAYAVEYGLRLRARGLRVCAVDMGVTHNSLTVNLDRLDVAYEAVAAEHPDAMPVMTPQGLVGGPPRARDRAPRLLSSQRWRYRWLRESLEAHAARRAAGGSPCVLADIRLDVDELLARLPTDTPLHVISHGVFADETPGPLALMRLGRPILLSSAPLEAIPGLVGHGPALVTNLALEDVRRLAPQLPTENRILGFRASIGYWMLIGVPPQSVPPAWHERRARPLGMSVPGQA